MNYIVTGGAGFIGKNLLHTLLKNPKNNICVIDNFISSDRDAFYSEFHDRCGLHFLESDISDPSFLPYLKNFVDNNMGNQVDRIFHLACPASPPAYQANPIHTMMTSILGTRNMLEFATWKKARILFTSTSEIYGDPDVSPQHEQYRGNVNTTGIRACYDEGKRAAETLCFDYNRVYDTNIAVVRIFNTYGPRMKPDDGRVVSNFITQCIKGQPLTVYGDGRQTRSFCYVEDMVDGLICTMSKDNFAGPVNLGNPNERSVMDLVKLIQDTVGKPSTITHMDLPEDDPKVRCPDISLAAKELGWHPKVSLEDGLVSTIKYFSEITR